MGQQEEGRRGGGREGQDMDWKLPALWVLIDHIYFTLPTRAHFFYTIIISLPSLSIIATVVRIFIGIIVFLPSSHDSLTVHSTFVLIFTLLHI